MRPPFSMVLFTALAGAGQGVLLAIFGVEVAAALGLIAMPAASFFVAAALLALLLSGAGLIAATFHLGQPLRAWRAAASWRTSWLSREIVVLPVFMAAVALWGLAHWMGAPSIAIGVAASALALLLFLCTGMIYGAIRTIREWATPLTPLNFAVLGIASGSTLAAALTAAFVPSLAQPLATTALAATVLGVVTRGAQWWRNESLRPVSSLQSAIGVRHPRIVAKPGMTAGTFNAREFFHGRSLGFVRNVRWMAILLGFALPIAGLAIAGASLGAGGLAVIGLAQWAGLVAERWVFFADARHPQNLYSPPAAARA
jgi:DMSO reductase anchor subunit